MVGPSNTVVDKVAMAVHSCLIKVAMAAFSLNLGLELPVDLFGVFMRYLVSSLVSA